MQEAVFPNREHHRNAGSLKITDSDSIKSTSFSRENRRVRQSYYRHYVALKNALGGLDQLKPLIDLEQRIAGRCRLSEATQQLLVRPSMLEGSQEKSMSKCAESLSEGGGQDVAISVPLPTSHFHMSPSRRQR
jgi:hypothetical protein